MYRLKIENRSWPFIPALANTISPDGIYSCSWPSTADSSRPCKLRGRHRCAVESWVVVQIVSKLLIDSQCLTLTMLPSCENTLLAFLLSCEVADMFKCVCLNRCYINISKCSITFRGACAKMLDSSNRTLGRSIICKGCFSTFWQGIWGHFPLTESVEPEHDLFPSLTKWLCA